MYAIRSYYGDITLKRQAEEAAKRQQLEMAHMSRLLSVGEMATGLAHEINQPLAAISYNFV